MACNFYTKLANLNEPANVGSKIFASSPYSCTLAQGATAADPAFFLREKKNPPRQSGAGSNKHL